MEPPFPARYKLKPLAETRARKELSARSFIIELPFCFITFLHIHGTMAITHSYMVCAQGRTADGAAHLSMSLGSQLNLST
jgi:hypothetical protein